MRIAVALRFGFVLGAGALLASGCLGDLGLFTGGEGEIAQGGRGSGGLPDGSAWPDGAKPDGSGDALGGFGGSGFGGSSSGGSPSCNQFDLALNLINPNCAACADSACCSELASCAQDSECAAIMSCIAACPSTDSACSDACLAQHEAGIGPATPLADCAGQSCHNDCTQCGGVGSFISLGATCDACIRTNCCSQAAACGHDPACAGYAACFVTCGSTDTKCLDGCDAKYPGGATAASPLADCLSAACASASCESCGALDVTLGFSPECGACIAQNCCSVSAACGNDAECIAYSKCILACPSGDTACASGCAGLHPNGKPLADAIVSCLGTVSPPCPC